MTVSLLRVVLNKWAVVDANGFPKGVCVRDPKVTRGSRNFIGMRIIVEESVLPQPVVGEKEAEFGRTYGPGTLRPKGAKEKVAHEYVDETTTIENTPFHREMVRRGNLFAADIESFRAVFSTVDGFAEPVDLLELARIRALNQAGVKPVVKEKPEAGDDSGVPGPPMDDPPATETTGSDGTKPVPVETNPRMPPGRTPPIVPNIQTVKE
jgi:hypothetical protein